MKIQLDMYQTIAAAVLVLMLGKILYSRSGHWRRHFRGVYLYLLCDRYCGVFL